MDASPFASLGQIRILLIPIGGIGHSAFLKHARLVRSLESIRLGDIPPDSREDRNRFIPSPLSTGYVHLNYTSNPPPVWHSALSLFRLSAFPLGVIGIADCSKDSSLSDIVAEFNATLSHLFPLGSPFPFARKCFAFEEGDGSLNLNVGQNMPELVTIPNLMGNKQVYLGTLLAELCHDILTEFPSLVRALDSSKGLEALNSTILPTLSRSKTDGVFFLNADPSVTSPPSFGRHTSAPPGSSQLSLSRSNTLDAASLSRASTPVPLRSNGVFAPERPGSGSNSPRISTLGVPMTNKKRTSMQGPSSGRLAKILGDMYLLAGKLSDASYWYNEALSLFRTAQESIWNASTLEGLCTIEVLEAWSAGDSLHTSMAGNVLGDPWAQISDRMGQAINLYSRAPPFLSSSSTIFPASSPFSNNAMVSESSSLVLLYTSAVLRYSRLLFAIWCGKGWNPLSLSLMLTTTLPPILSTDNNLPPPSSVSTTPQSPTTTAPAINAGPSSSSLFRLTTRTTLTRAQISQVLSQAHGPFLLHLATSDQVRVLEELSVMYSSIGFKRKEALLLRGVLAGVMDLIVQGRQSSEGNPLTSPVSGNISRETYGNESGGNIGVRETDRSDGNTSLIRMVQYIAAVYGIDLGRVKLHSPQLEAQEERGKGRASSLEGGLTSSDETRADEDLEQSSFGWPDLQVGVAREAMAVAETLPEYHAVAQFALSTLKLLNLHLSPSDQYLLYQSASRGVTTARRRGSNRLLDFWGGPLAVGIEICPISPTRLPTEHPRQELDMRYSVTTAVRTGPFIYQPKGKAKTTSQSLVQNESVEFILTLRNPYMFDFEIQSLVVSTSGIPFHTQPVSVVIPSNSFHTIPLSGIPLETGTLTIRGVVLHLSGGAPHELVLPLNDHDHVSVSTRENLSERIKATGLEANPLSTLVPMQKAGPSSKKPKVPTPSAFLQCTVVPEQPLARVRRSSLTHGALMLYDGETSEIRLTIENISNIPVDFYRLTFDDSTIAPAQHALAEGDLSIAEAYETEYDLVHRPVFRWEVSTDRNMDILPGGTKVIKVECTGKIGCSRGTIQFAYSYARRSPSPPHTSPTSSTPDVFHTRSIVYPVNVTVFRTLEVRNLDILPFKPYQVLPSTPATSTQTTSAWEEEERARRALLDVQEEHEGDWCLVSVDVGNVYGLPFEVFLDRAQDDAAPASMSRLIAPGSTARLFIPVKRLALSHSESLQPIPALSDRQFVVAKDKLSSEEDRLQRELFWYREKLFNILTCRWVEPGTNRAGTLSLRSQRLTMPMREALRSEVFAVELSLHGILEGDEGSDTVRQVGQSWQIKPYELVHLTITLRNLSAVPSHISVSCMPVAPTTMEHAIFEGFLTENHMGLLESGASVNKSFAVCFVANGSYDFKVEAVQVGENGRIQPGVEKLHGAGTINIVVRA